MEIRKKGTLLKVSKEKEWISMSKRVNLEKIKILMAHAPDNISKVIRYTYIFRIIGGLKCQLCQYVIIYFIGLPSQSSKEGGCGRLSCTFMAVKTQ